MSTIRTNLSATREGASQIRFQQAAGINKTNVQSAIEQLATSPPAVNPTPVNAGQSPYAPTINDSLIEVDTSGGPVTIAMPLSAARNGRVLAIKDISGDARTNNITVTFTGGQTADGLSPFLIEVDFGGVVLNPGAAGYSVAP